MVEAGVGGTGSDEGSGDDGGAQAAKAAAKAAAWAVQRLKEDVIAAQAADEAVAAAAAEEEEDAEEEEEEDEDEEGAVDEEAKGDGDEPDNQYLVLTPDDFEPEHVPGLNPYLTTYPEDRAELANGPPEKSARPQESFAQRLAPAEVVALKRLYRHFGGGRAPPLSGGGSRPSFGSEQARVGRVDHRSVGGGRELRSGAERGRGSSNRFAPEKVSEGVAPPATQVAPSRAPPATPATAPAEVSAEVSAGVSAEGGFQAALRKLRGN
jgi:hypothetical protein